MTHKVKIIEVRDDVFVVETTLSNGFTSAQKCDTLEQANVYMRGLQDGFTLAKNAIDIGLRFTGVVDTEGKGD